MVDIVVAAGQRALFSVPGSLRISMHSPTPF